MRDDVRRQWAAALRSPRFVQGVDHERYTEAGVTRHCVLGVLAQLYEDWTGDRSVWAPCGTSVVAEMLNTRCEGFFRWAGVCDPGAALAAWTREDGDRIMALVAENDAGVAFQVLAGQVEAR